MSIRLGIFREMGVQQRWTRWMEGDGEKGKRNKQRSLLMMMVGYGIWKSDTGVHGVSEAWMGRHFEIFALSLRSKRCEYSTRNQTNTNGIKLTPFPR